MSEWITKLTFKFFKRLGVSWVELENHLRKEAPDGIDSALDVLKPLWDAA